jgi:hypothetical protein
MVRKCFVQRGLVGLILIGGSLGLAAQTLPRRATIQGNGQATDGKCTVEVIVDGVAEVEIEGDMALLRNFSGQTPQWRRFQCTAMPPRVPLNFRFQGVDGRGKQTLAVKPGAGAPAVVRIEDAANGSDGYTFDIMWSGAGDPRGGIPGPGTGGGFGGRVGGGADFDRDRGSGGRTSFDQAMRVCEDAVIDQALDRLRPQVIAIRRTAMDDGPGRTDFVVGAFEVRQGRNWDRYRFECSVDLNTGRVRTADFTPAGRR